jgi:SAM-dependent methyltransferase
LLTHKNSSASAELLAGKPEIPTRQVEACLGDPRAGSTVVAQGYDFEYQTCANQFEIRRANDCPLLYLFPQPIAEAFGVIYPAEYLPFQFHELRGLTRWARDFVQGGKARSILKLSGATGKILDVGCGSGMLLRQIARAKGNRGNLWANDLSADLLEPIRREGFETIPGLIDNLDTAERFRVITLNQVIEHLPDPKSAVRRLSNLLEPRGYLFFETPCIDGLDAKLFRTRYWGGYHIPRHFWLFNEASLTQLLEGAGMRVVEVSYLCSPAFWIQSFHHLLLDHGWYRVARFFSEKNPLLLAPFTALDLIRIAAGARTTNIRVIAQKSD